MHLKIKHEKTKVIGLAASFLFDKLIKEERERWKRYRITIHLSGVVTLRKVRNFLLSYGLLKELGIKPSEDFVDKDYANKYITLKRIGSKKENYKKSVASTDLVNYFNQCFNYNGLEITENAKGFLIDAIGELIGNAEEHCGNKIGEWFALGCYDKEEHNCSFAIINYGKTIYESLSDEISTASEVITKIQTVISKNRPFLQKLHGMISREHEEPIWNVMALQDGISSKRTLTGKGRTRGQGFMDVLSFIDRVKAENNGAEICLISGHSAIIIDYLHPILSKKVGENQEKRRLITFNKEGMLTYPPDQKKVIFLKDKFEGTIFAGSFKIDEKYLTQKLSKLNGKTN